MDIVGMDTIKLQKTSKLPVPGMRRGRNRHDPCCLRGICGWRCPVSFRVPMVRHDPPIGTYRDLSGLMAWCHCWITYRVFLMEFKCSSSIFFSMDVHWLIILAGRGRTFDGCTSNCWLKTHQLLGSRAVIVSGWTWHLCQEDPCIFLHIPQFITIPECQVPKNI